MAKDTKAARERALRTGGKLFGGLALLLLAAAAATSLWARHSFTPVEAMVALHASMFAHGEGLYYKLNQYPFTVSPYGPLLYGLSAGLHLLGLPLYQAARAISFLALLGALWSGWRILGYLKVDQWSQRAAILLAGATANLVLWGTTGQVDMLAAALSIAAFERLLAWHASGKRTALVTAGALIVLSVFTKQTALAGGTTIGLWLLWNDRRTAVRWIAGVLAAGIAVALALNASTHGGWVENAILANLNPFAWHKLESQASYFLLTSSGLLILALAGLGKATRDQRWLFVYAGLATLVWLATAPKEGSDLNYQIEMTLLWALCAGCSLSRLEFHAKAVAGDRSWVTLLQIPLVLHLVLNLLITAKSVVVRAVIEPERRQAMAALAPHVADGRVLVSDYDALLQLRGRTEVETLIYTLLVDAGRMDPRPVIHDIEAGKFRKIVLWKDLTAAAPAGMEINKESLELPADVARAVRENYRLSATVPEAFFGPYHVYEPKRLRAETAAAR